MSDVSATVHAGTSFAISDRHGQISSGNHGLYFQDERFLSKLEVTLGGKWPMALSVVPGSQTDVTFIGTNPDLAGVERSTLQVTRGRRLLEDQLTEEIDIHNYGDATAALDVAVAMAADFASIFQVKSQVQTGQGSIHRDVSETETDRGRRFTYQAGQQRLEAEIVFSRTPQGGGPGEAHFAVSIPRHGHWTLTLVAHLRVNGAASTSRPSGPHAKPSQARPPQQEAPTLETDHAILREAYARASADLAALRIKAAESEGYEIAAGMPWYMTLFGRDSLIASYQAMLHDATLARGTLRALAHLQGQHEDPETLEEPGRILHEYRNGIAGSGRRAVPHFPYYGTVDATPLFLVVLSEYARVTGDLALVGELWSSIEAGVRWAEDYGDRDGDGFIEYDPPPGNWLKNLGWKDSDDSVRFRDGRVARPAIALVEVQGYLVDALRRVGELCDALSKPGGDQLRARAANLQRAIAERFWVAERGYFAEALDGAKRPVDALTSNPGHLLWAGAVTAERAARMAEVLLSPEMFTGFGVRTMGNAEGGYNPISYHNGSVWPHDNALILEGLARHHQKEAARRLAEGLLASLAAYPNRRWPELFDGYEREAFGAPIAYPDANSPQAWATGAVMQLVRALLGISVNAFDRTLRLDPLEIAGMSYLRLRGMRVSGVALDVTVKFLDGSPEVSVDGLPPGWH